jgi:hypothetical protein
MTRTNAVVIALATELAATENKTSLETVPAS